jgi:hypothetical protein
VLPQQINHLDRALFLYKMAVSIYGIKSEFFRQVATFREGQNVAN